ncbi:MAG TPA: hypothetical protein VHL31_10495 [Geminicoccus sp.]|uniref:hypothetical protein n=1 Tax=Geminicoccus sp. TaxID=2024832 RepID=UPI002E3240B6|nr:hypothetical protein [Geminicoccus sp.]HEX2526710.1 hypothetical protein [Geminicoccus sp.]
MAATAADVRDAARHLGYAVGKAARTLGAEAPADIVERAHEVNEQALNTADHARASLTANYEQIKRDLDVLRGQMLGLGADATEEAKLRLNDGLETLAKRVDALSQDAQVYGGRKIEEAERLIQERPFTSVLVSFGLGMLFAQFFRR